MAETANIIDSLQIVSWRSRPGSFVALMSVYESNYLRFRQLVSDVTQIEGRVVSTVPAQCDLVLTVGERGPYTTTLKLTYWLPDELEPEVPDMTLRLYHDARLLEAQAWATSHRHDPLRRIRAQVERELDQRWARNQMLNKWLEYCIECGHRFEARPRNHESTGDSQYPETTAAG
jgi:uncharacterized protein YqiB (DUF1249 family)